MFHLFVGVKIMGGVVDAQATPGVDVADVVAVLAEI